MYTKCKNAIAYEIQDYKILLRNVPSLAMAVFVISVVLMNILANKEIQTNVTWLACDCGILMSWLSFLAMDVLTKRFGAKASVKLSILAVAINLFVCFMFYIVSVIPGNWGEFYTFNDEIINQGLNNTFGGTWYILIGSTVAFIISSIVNATTNAAIGKLCKRDNFISYAIRCYVSTLLAQFLDNLVFALVVSHTFFGWTLLQCITCSIIGCMLELLCEVVFSPFGYMICKRWDSENIGHEYIAYANDIKEN